MRRSTVAWAALLAGAALPTPALAAAPFGVAWTGSPQRPVIAETATIWLPGGVPFTLDLPPAWFRADAFDGPRAHVDPDSVATMTVLRRGQQSDYARIVARRCDDLAPLTRGGWAVEFPFLGTCTPLDASELPGGVVRLSWTLPAEIAGGAALRYVTIVKDAEAPPFAPASAARQLRLRLADGRSAQVTGRPFPAARVGVGLRKAVEGSSVPVRLRGAPPRTPVEISFTPISLSGGATPATASTVARGRTDASGRLSAAARVPYTGAPVAWLGGRTRRPGLSQFVVETDGVVLVAMKPPRVRVRAVAGAAGTYDVLVQAARGSIDDRAFASISAIDDRGRVRGLGSVALEVRPVKAVRVRLRARERFIEAYAKGEDPYPRVASKPTRVARPR